MSEHSFLMWGLVALCLEVVAVGFMAYRTWRSSERLEGLIAATYLEARKALTQQR
jgi:hypothetical protein